MALSEYDWDEIWNYGGANTPPIRHGHVVLHEWTNDDPELVFCAIIVDTVGDYYAVEGWTDYTGWGCRDDVTWYGPFNSVMTAANNLDRESRRHLGFEHAPVPNGLYRD